MSGGEIGGLIGVLVILAGVNEFFVEEVFGSWVKGWAMKVLALASGVGIAYAARAIATQVPLLDPLSKVDMAWLWLVGLFFVGGGSKVVHGLTNRLSTKKSRLIDSDGPINITLRK